MSLNEALADSMAEFICRLSKRLSDDVLDRLKEMAEAERNPAGREIYASMFRNLEAAERLNRPVCQDTGLPMFFIKAGTRFPYLDDVQDSFTEAVRRATAAAPLRPNAVEIFGGNTGNNIAEKIPWFEWELAPKSDSLEAAVYMSGGGCSLPGRARVLMPSEGLEGVAAFVLDTIVEFGANACPPLVVGVGAGASAEIAALLSKKALLRRIGSRNPDPKAAGFERLLEKAVSGLGMGAQGLPGSAAVMAVHMEFSARHTATLAAGISFGCWSHRRGRLIYNAKLEPSGGN
ncbi:MAG: L(+)-tartrate dehydratase subunit alpha [Oscillospiraceae bacterium]|jgi:L(+)-tartrate dehydratase alpha subunit|nr:L(+)-tartrate dehydratase subunit alpha [Oscillospiraceae bacterium]